MIYMLSIMDEEYSFQSEDRRDAFISGYTYAIYGDDPEAHDNAEYMLGIEEWEIE